MHKSKIGQNVPKLVAPRFYKLISYSFPAVLTPWVAVWAVIGSLQLNSLVQNKSGCMIPYIVKGQRFKMPFEITCLKRQETHLFQTSGNLALERHRSNQMRLIVAFSLV